MSSESNREHDLLRLAQSGDTNAFAALQMLLEPSATRFVRRLIGMSDSGEDIVQEAFFALYMNLERLDPPEKLRPFLFRVIRNRCYDELRAQGRYEVVSFDDEAAAPQIQVDAEAAAPDETTHWLLIYAEVQQAMTRLAEAQRQTLLLYSEVGLSYAEIAETMQVGIGTVKSRLYYAKRNLVRLLSPETRQALEIQGENEHV